MLTKRMAKFYIVLIFLSVKLSAQLGTLTGWGMSVCNLYSFSICPGQTITPFDYGSQWFVCNSSTMDDVSFVNQGPVWRVARHSWTFTPTGSAAQITGTDPSNTSVSWPISAGAVLSPSVYTTISSIDYIRFSINNTAIPFTVRKDNFDIQLTSTTTPLSVNSTTICSGQTTTLMVNGATNYTWNPGNFTGQNLVVNPVATTVYTVTGDNGNCTFISAGQGTVNVLPKPSLTVTGNTFVCRGKATKLTATGASNYTWTTGALVSSISASPINTTNYTVTGTAANGCSNKAVVTVSVSECLGLEETVNQQSSILYPNPFNQHLAISCGDKCTVIILDTFGKVVYEEQQPADSHSINNLNHLASGIYFVILKSGRGIRTYKVAKE